MSKHFTFKNIFILSVLFRIIAVVFAKGYAFSDDHFEVVEIANKLLHHEAITANGEIYLFNLIYIYFNTAILGMCNLLHITNADTQMFVVRFFHALISLLTVVYGYKIAQLLQQKINANSKTFVTSKAPEIVAFLLGLFWLFPFMSVRNLREFFCIPFLLIAFYHLLKNEAVETQKIFSKPLILASLFLVLAFIVRLQTMFFPAGVGLAFLLQRRYKQAFAFGILFLFFLAFTQFLFDYYYWNNPFASLLAYVKYNANNYKDYPNGAWYQYILTILGVFIFPASLMFVVGYFQNIKKQLLLFLPSFLFIVFHSIFPNKQERFILSVLPFILILGVFGFAHFYEKNNQKKWLQLLTKTFSIWFIGFNTIALFVLSCTYSKRSRVEAMLYLKQKNDVQNIAVQTNGDDIPFLPTFYLEKKINYVELFGDTALVNYKKQLDTKSIVQPNYIIFLGNENLEQRVKAMKIIHNKLTAETTVASGLVDNIAYYLNPKHNVNESWYVYKVN